MLITAMPVLQSAAGTIIGGAILGLVAFGFHLGWNADHRSDRRLGYQLGVAGLVGAGLVIWIATLK